MAEPRQRPALDDVKKGKILGILSMGCSRHTAARLVGCSPTTIWRAVKRYPAFAESIVRAESELEILSLKRINEAAKKEQYWRAAAWVLERRYPEGYAARKPGTITVSQMLDLLKQVSDLLMDETMDVGLRERIRRRVTALGRSLYVMAGVDADP